MHPYFYGRIPLRYGAQPYVDLDEGNNYHQCEEGQCADLSLVNQASE
jgi:hypothetical protein